MKLTLNSLILVNLRIKNLNLNSKKELKIQIESLQMLDDLTHYVTISGLSFSFRKKPINTKIKMEKELLLLEDIKEKKNTVADSIDVHFGNFNTTPHPKKFLKNNIRQSVPFESPLSSVQNLKKKDFIFENHLNIFIKTVSIKINTNLLSRLLFIKNRIMDVFISLFDTETPFKQSKDLI
jgi:hypothetical protein